MNLIIMIYNNGFSIGDRYNQIKHNIHNDIQKK